MKFNFMKIYDVALLVKCLFQEHLIANFISNSFFFLLESLTIISFIYLFLFVF